ncbi:uncharacterized protein PHALS_08449 [Plasmopara halstedii]|uniref:Uncharacterized protein n=1 Tax=Plasmopara halstedii TaxID=4781 RepID=A0A0P1AD28_PLAHL|nr:uncharacterized protein PHALS_08449 [Plasmopara halstedii]CEG38370.1 hypothetical protein PHALS_08449 [Plasmopara halstedii]|eukprot:XP_024574739.1 hypothetical protein PHALS_08449 [Plasmopara halstedii]
MVIRGCVIQTWIPPTIIALQCLCMWNEFIQHYWTHMTHFADVRTSFEAKRVRYKVIFEAGTQIPRNESSYSRNGVKTATWGDNSHHLHEGPLGRCGLPRFFAAT